MRAIAVLVLLAGSALVSAQSAPSGPPPAFEVASVKPNNSGASGSSSYTGKGRLTATNVQLRLLGRGGAECLVGLDRSVEHHELSFDRKLVMGELRRLLPRPLFHDDDVEPAGRQLLRQHAARGTGADDDEVDGIALAVRSLFHVASSARSAAGWASYHPKGAE